MNRQVSNVVQMRLEGMSLREIAERISLSHERVNQIFHNAIAADPELKKQWADFQKQKHRARSRYFPDEKRLIGRYGKYALRMKIRPCLGCGKKFNATKMRTHKCKVAWYLRVGWKYNPTTGRPGPDAKAA